MGPQDDEEEIFCFTVIGHDFLDVASNVKISYISVLDFEGGILEIQTNDISLLGQTKLISWLVSIDDGTVDKNIMTFEVTFK